MSHFLLAAVLLCSSAFAQEYPSKPIRIIVTFAAGGTSDLLSRAVGAKLTAALGQQVITDNRPGAGSVIGTDMLAEAYKGGAPAAADLAEGQVQFMINSPPSVLPFVKAGKVRALAVTGAQRSPGLSEVPTIRESGFPDYETYEWYGLFAPAKVPKEIVARLAREVRTIVRDPALRERMLVPVP